MNVLEIKNLKVKVDDKAILEDVTLSLENKESYILFGSNGSGKTTLINAIIGTPTYEVVSGKILFNGEDITKRNVDERSKLGIFVAFQNPPEITGIKLADLLKLCLSKDTKYTFNEGEKRLIEAFKLTQFLNRDVNVGFSGGERKRAEILQMIFLKPKLALLDEPDSGVDVESLKLIASEIEEYVEETGSSALIITHKGDILDYIGAKHACILLEGKIHCYADPKKIYEDIKKNGYEECVRCRERVLGE